MDDDINKQEAERSTCKRDRHPVDVGLDQVALGCARLAQVLQVLKHLRLGHRCSLEVLELGGAAEPCICIHVFTGSFTMSCAEQFVSSFDAIFVVKLFG